MYRPVSPGFLPPDVVNSEADGTEHQAAGVGYTVTLQ